MSETLPSTQSLSTGTFFDRIRPASVDGHRSDRDRPTSSLSLPWNRATKQSPLRHSLGDCDDTGLATTRGTPYRRGSASPRTSTDSAFTTGCFSFGTQSPVSPSPVLGPAQHPVSRSPVLGPTRHPMSHSPALSPRQQPVSRSPVLGPTQHPPRPPNCAYTDSAAATLATSKRAQSLIRSPTVLPATPFSASGSVSNAVATSARATSPTTTTATAAEAGFPEHSPLDEDVVVAPARIHSLSYLQSENFGSFSRDSAGPDRSLSRLSMKHGTAAAAAAVPARTSTSTTTTITAPSLQHNAVGAVSVSTDVSHDCTLHEKDVRPASSSSSGRLVDGDADGGDSEVMTSAAVHAGSGLQKVTSKAVEELEQREADETLVGNGQEIAAGAEDQSPGGAMEDVVAKEMILGSDVGVFKVFEVDENGAVVSAPQA
ncbi:hypothetical protein M427DRAFT_468747 [Gonapodya prolifera JEL478]|uniref:Uncharacterized protein n=1 Tax=Gonapodya prolifera (strain JEL478) TaxID=1344416 RepID=A0A139AQP9_GONPJ|nr:hypothetical protein M427DRAFT_468747 [Gonapodya prolifera JEL478]|eukprot:KXS19087.1 hypothetical protein M427DRAFT_468747 [Gonapodya prolifera JEL478]